MNIKTVANDIYKKTTTDTPSSKALEQNKAVCRSSPKGDSIEISSEAYEAQYEDEKMTASSGKDILGITKGREENTFVIHFSDSAMVNRAISRGFITVNGVQLELSDEVKKNLLQVDKQAQADREKAYIQYIMQHEMAVAEQQADTYKKFAEDTARAFEIAAKISSGGKASPIEEQELMEFNPELYAMAKNAAMMAKRHEKKEEEVVYKPEKLSGKKVNQEETKEGVQWSSFKWKSYETRMNVSLAESPEIQVISKGEINTL